MKFDLKRSVNITTDIQSLRDHLVNLRNWPLWSPWLSSEPDAHISFSEDGTQQKWKGELVGEGSLAVKDVHENIISYDLHFIKPFASKAITSFSLRDNHDGSVHVTWSMNGHLPWFTFFAKNIITSVQKMDYDRGLHMLKSLIETGTIHSSLSAPHTQTFDTIHYVGVNIKNCPLAEIASHQPDYEKIAKDISSHGKILSALSVYHKLQLIPQLMDFTAGFRVEKEVADIMRENSDYTVGTIQGGNTVHTTHTGSYHHLGNAWSAAMTFARYKKQKTRRDISGFEIYSHMDEKNHIAHITDLFLPLRS